MNRTWIAVSALTVGLLAACAVQAGEPAATTTTGTPDVYFVPFSHLDLFWGGTREECLARGCNIIAKAIRLARQSPQFRFLLEDEVFVANYLDSHRGAPEVEQLKKLVRSGQIEIAPKWAAIYQDLPDGEVQVRNLAIGKRYARDVFGVDPQVAHLGDLPGYTPQFPQILSQSRIPFAVMTRMGPADKSLFHWKSPDGSRTLVWNSLKSYCWGTFLHSSRMTDEQKLARFRKDLADVQATTSGPILMHFGCDLWSPPDNLVEIVERFNARAPARLIFATPVEYFRRVQSQPGTAEVSGEIPSSWPNLIASLPHLWPPITPATNTLLAAEKFAAINDALGYADYPGGEFETLWKSLLEALDHNQDGQGGLPGDRGKIEGREVAALRGGQILRDMLRNLAERVEVPVPGSFPIVVFNPMSWTRDDLVQAHVTLFGEANPADLAAFKKGMRLVDETGQSIPFHIKQYSENISRALEMAFVARGVPSLGYRTYYLVAAEQADTFPPTAKVTLDAERDLREPRRPLGSDKLENAFYRLSVDRATGRVALFDKELNREVCRDMEVSALEERGGNYIGIEPPSGRTLISVVDRVAVEENNAVRAVVRIDLRIADIPIVQRLTLYHDLKRLDIENTVDWRSHRFLRIRQVFPAAVSNAAIHYGVPFGANVSTNILPGAGTRFGDEITNESWRRSRLIHDWLHLGAGDWGMTIAADHAQFRLEDEAVVAEMVRGTRFTSVKVVRGEDVGSMQYPPPGSYTFRYALASAPGDWKAAKAYRAGLGFNSRLLPVYVADAVSTKSLPPTASFCTLKQDNVVVSALKKADVGPSLVLRAYEIEGSPLETSLEFLGRPATVSEVNLLEEDVQQSPRQSLRGVPYAIKTVKLELPKTPGRTGGDAR